MRLTTTSLTALKLRALLPWETFAPHQLGARYATGEGAPKDEAAAVRWYRLAARRGDPESQYDLGFMILLGEGVSPRPDEAVRWLRSSAELGFDPAARLLADLYREGRYGIEPSSTEAERWERAAREKGSAGR